MTRVAYDHSTASYAFRDKKNPDTIFVGQPGEEYGVMVPESEAAKGMPLRGLGRKPTRASAFSARGTLLTAIQFRHTTALCATLMRTVTRTGNTSARTGLTDPRSMAPA
jgi:hypothetical protein